jgi:5S rRNA maturation endonuclease (ribonuclease M5)
MTFKPGDIVGLPYPFSDLTSRKKRPVLILTREDYRGDFMGLAITSVLTEDNSVSIETSEQNFSSGCCIADDVINAACRQIKCEVLSWK